MRWKTKIGVGLALLVGFFAAMWWLRRTPETAVTGPQSVAAPAGAPATSVATLPAEAPIAEPPLSAPSEAEQAAVTSTTEQSSGAHATHARAENEITPAQQSPALIATVADEIAGTRQMVLAHAPLRAPEVADPDSAANRRILQTMIGKALVRPDAPPAGTSN